MNGSNDGDRDAPRDEPEDREPGAEERDTHPESGGDESAPPASGPDSALRADDPVLDIALEPVTVTLGELVSVDTTPPDAGRTEGGHTPRSRGSAGSGSSRGDARSLRNDIPSNTYHVEAGRTDDELVVTAELPDVAAEELFVGLNEEERSLVVAVDDAVVAREFYPWEAVEVTSTRFDAPGLEVRLEPADESTSE